MPVKFDDENLEGLLGSEKVAVEQLSRAVDEAERGIEATPPVDAPRAGSSAPLSLKAAGTTLELLSVALALIESSVATSVATVEAPVREKALSALAEESSRLRAYWDRLSAANDAVAARALGGGADDATQEMEVGSVPGGEEEAEAGEPEPPVADGEEEGTAAAPRRVKKKVKVKKRKRT
jgi:hypothetical protein